MSYIKHLEHNLVEIFKLFILTTLILVINLVIIMLCSKNYINQNWTKYRCNPLVAPFASFFGHDTFDNFGQCLFSQTAGYTKIFLEPIHYMMQIITKIFHYFREAIQDIRKVIYKIRIFFQWIVKDVMQRFQDAAATLQFFFAKLKDIFAKSYAIFVTVGYMMYTSYQAFLSIWHGPIGWVARQICFDGNTKIVLDNGKQKKIKNIKIGDILSIGKNVMGLLKFEINDVDMYNYCDVIVSGSHLVKENNKWLRVSESTKGIKLKGYNQKFIYCLITKNNRILVKTKNNRIEFSDYIETNDPLKNNMIKEFTINKLNNKNLFNPLNVINYEKISETDYYLTGFMKNTKILMDNGYYKKIKNIKIGDKLKYGKVTGKIKQKVLNPNELVKIKTDKQNIVLSKKQIILYNKKWIKVGDIKKTNYKFKYKYLYNLCIDKNVIKIDNLFFRDYLENTEINSNKFIDKFVANNNKKIFL